MEDEPEVVTLLDDEGVEHRFQLHDAFDLDGVTHYLVESTDDPEQVIILRDTPDGLEPLAEEEVARVVSALEEDEETDP